MKYEIPLSLTPALARVYRTARRVTASVMYRIGARCALLVSASTARRRRIADVKEIGGNSLISPAT